MNRGSNPNLHEAHESYREEMQEHRMGNYHGMLTYGKRNVIGANRR